MDPKNAGEVLKHLDKQNELLEDAHKKMSFELHRLQVEEEMLMRKFYELSSALGLNKKALLESMSASGSTGPEAHATVEKNAALLTARASAGYPSAIPSICRISAGLQYPSELQATV